MDVKHDLTEKGKRDFELIQRALNEDDQSAYAQLLQHYREPVYYLMLKMTGNPYDAEDCTIEAFGKAFKRLEQYTPDYGFSTWLFRIATNNCIDFQRKNKVQTVSLTEREPKNQTSLQLTDNGPDPEASIIHAQKLIVVRQVIEKLKPHYRSMIEMRYFEEMSYEEIAEKMHLPLGTVKAQLFRAREFLFQLLKRSQDKF
ncbi:MAG: RNA polymerase sigma-70 factor ECF subfamily [Bacteroidetes bacterium]|nr:MAG: RNA polymerase sigma-70 factor ECF subfamily [Bacteroidota bacterium]